MKKEAQTKVNPNPEKQKLNSQKEALRAAKKSWNAKSTAFQNKLKEFKSELYSLKNMLNGRVEGRERVKLWEEMPPEVEAALSELTSSYSSRNEEAAALLQQAKTIIDYQKGYASNQKTFFQKLENQRQQEKNKTMDIKKSDDQNFSLYSEAIHPIQLAIQNARAMWPFLNQKEKNKISALNKIYKIDSLYSDLEDKILKIKNKSDLNETERLLYNIDSLLENTMSSAAVKNLIRENLSTTTDSTDAANIIKKIKIELRNAYSSLATLDPKIRKSSDETLIDGMSLKDHKKVCMDNISQIQRILSGYGLTRTSNLDKVNSIDRLELDDLVRQIDNNYRNIVSSLKSIVKVMFDIGSLDNMVQEYSAIKHISSLLESQPSTALYDFEDASEARDGASDTLFSKVRKKINRFLNVGQEAADLNVIYDTIHTEIRPEMAVLMDEIYKNDITDSIIKTLSGIQHKNRDLSKKIKSILVEEAPANIKNKVEKPKQQNIK